MKSLRLAALGPTCCFSARLNAQQQAPTAPITPVPQAPTLNAPSGMLPFLTVPQILSLGPTLGTFEIVPTPLGTTFNIAAANVHTLDLLKAIAAKGDLQLIVADDAPNNLILNMQVSNATPQRAIEIVASSNGLAWGKVGAKTYLLVRLPSPIILGAAPIYRYSPAPSVKPPASDVPDGTPFFFNGQRYYIAPLQ